MCQKVTLCHDSYIGTLFRFLFEVVFLELSIEGFPANAEDSRSLRAVPVDTFHDPPNVTFLKFREGKERDIRGCRTALLGEFTREGVLGDDAVFS